MPDPDGHILRQTCSWAISRVLQCVLFTGIDSSVLVIKATLVASKAARTLTSVIFRTVEAPREPSASHNPIHCHTSSGRCTGTSGYQSSRGVGYVARRNATPEQLALLTATASLWSAFSHADEISTGDAQPVG